MPLAAPALAALLVAAQPPAREPRPASPALPEEEILGTPADWAIAGDAADRATVELAVGTELLEEPAPGAPVVAIFPGGRLPVWTTRLGWAQVIWDDVVAWVEIDPPEPPAAIELDAGPPPASPVGGDDPDEELIARGLELLGADGRRHPLAGLTFHTDLGDEATLGLLDAVAGQLPRIYAERYGLEATDPLRAVVFGFRSEAAFRALQARVGSSGGADLAGFASGGVAAVWLADRDRRQLARVVLHELCHLWNRHLLGPDLPIWLEEGLAEDLALAELGRRGELRPERVAVESRRRGPRVVVNSAATATLAAIAADAERRSLTPVSALLGMQNERFMAPEDRRRHYAQSGLLVRFLLADPLHRPAFLRILGGIASAPSVSHANAGAELLDLLAAREPLPKLDERLRAWILDLPLPRTAVAP